MIAFADTSYFLALLNDRDIDHPRAIALGPRIQYTVTTQFVMMEVAAAFSQSRHRAKFLRLVDQLESEMASRIIPCSEELYRAGVDLYRRRPDKDWSLTDCTSFVVMNREGLTDALTADHHFEQAGFDPWLK